MHDCVNEERPRQPFMHETSCHGYASAGADKRTETPFIALGFQQRNLRFVDHEEHAARPR